MKKQLILILSLILLVGLTAGILVVVNNAENKRIEEERRIEEAKNLISLSSTEIDRIEIDTKEELYKAFLDDSGQWALENETDFEINTYYLNSVASQLSALKASDIICPIAEADLADYGLDDPISITLYTDDESDTVNVGKLSATQEFYYVTIEGRDDIFGVSTDYADYLNISKNSLKSIYLLRNSDSPVNSISLEAHGETVYSISLNDEDIWTMQHPLETEERLDGSEANFIVTTIRQMIVDKFGDENVPESKFADYGFDDPEYVFTFTQENGETTTLLAKDYDTSGSTFVEFICVETGQVFFMESTYTSFLQCKPEELFVDVVYSCPIKEMESIDIQWKDRENAVITIDDENSRYTLNGVSLEDISKDAVSALEDFYRKIQALNFDTLVLESPADSTADPDIAIVYKRNDGTEITVTLYEVSEDTLAVYVNGEYSHFTLTKKNFTARDGIYDYFDQLLDTAGLE
jgi:hypothetical protein